MKLKIGVFSLLIFFSFAGFSDCRKEIAGLSGDAKGLTASILDLAQMALSVEDSNPESPEHVVLMESFIEKSQDLEKLSAVLNFSSDDREILKKIYGQQLDALRSGKRLAENFDLEEMSQARLKENEIFKTYFESVPQLPHGREEKLQIDESKLGRAVTPVQIDPLRKIFFATFNFSDQNMKSPKYYLQAVKMGNHQVLGKIQLPAFGYEKLIKWDPKGQMISVPRSDFKGITLFDPTLTKKLSTLDCSFSTTSRLQFSPDGQFVGTTQNIQRGETFGIWKIDSNFQAIPLSFTFPKEVNRRLFDNDSFDEIVFDSQSSRFFTRSSQGYVDLWDPVTLQYIKNIYSPSNGEKAMELSRDDLGNLALKISLPGNTLEYRGEILRTDGSIKRLDLGINNRLLALSPSPDSLWVAVVSRDMSKWENFLSVRSTITDKEVLRKILVTSKNSSSPRLGPLVWTRDSQHVTVDYEDVSHHFEKRIMP